MAGREHGRLPLPAGLSSAECDFYRELRRLIDAAGLTFRALEAATSSSQADPGEASFYSKSRWGRWVNGQSQPPRKAIKKLAEALAADEISAGHLLELWDAAFAPVPAPRVASESEPTEPVGPVGLAADRLARLVAQECAAELNDRVLQGWRPLAVGWRRYTGRHADPEVAAEPPPAGTFELLAGYVKGGHRVVVLGPGGAGKTTLATLLMAELLGGRRAGDPVPVLVPAASLVPGEMVRSWLERVLADRYPPLRDARVYGPGAVADLVAQHRVLPVIDGLDELEAGPRARLLGALGRAFGRREPLLVTSRAPDYHEAVEASGQMLPGAAVIELEPVPAQEAASFLERGTAGPRASSLRHVVDEIRSAPDGPLARALSSPLMIGLVRSGGELPVVEPQDDPAAIENRLLDGLVEARFGARARSEQARPEHPWRAADAHRWLVFLAGHLARLRSYDLDWMRLRYAVAAFTDPLRRAALGAALAWVLAGTAFGLSRGLSFGALPGLMDGLAHGLDAALVVGAIYLLAPLSYPAGAGPPWLRRLRQRTGTPLRTMVAVPAAYAVESGVRDGIGASRTHGITAGILLGLTAVALNWLVASVLVGLATRARLFDLAEKPVYFSLRVPGRRAEFARVLAVGAAWGAGLGLAVGFAVMILGNLLALEHPLWGFGIPAGAVIGAAFALVGWGRTPVESAPAASPASTLRADRNLVLLLAVPFLLVIPAFFGAAFARDAHGFLRFGLYGLAVGVTIWLAIALSHAWPQYLIAAGWLAARGRLPWRLAAFLSEACAAQVLRQRGGAYQFRHARLQDRLAGSAVAEPGHARRGAAHPGLSA